MTAQPPTNPMLHRCLECGEIGGHNVDCSRNIILNIHSTTELNHTERLLARAVVEQQYLCVWILGSQEHPVTLDNQVAMNELPQNVQEAVKKLRKEMYGIE